MAPQKCLATTLLQADFGLASFTKVSFRLLILTLITQVSFILRDLSLKENHFARLRGRVTEQSCLPFPQVPWASAEGGSIAGLPCLYDPSFSFQVEELRPIISFISV